MEEIKDLGGLVNKDLAFSKLPQGAVYDSQNFRISTNDGNTSAARETVRGTVQIGGIPSSPCINRLDISNSLTNVLIQGLEYSLTLSLAGAIFTSYTFTYSNITSLISGFVNFINTDQSYIDNSITATAPQSGNYLLISVPGCLPLTVESFNLSNGGNPNSTFPYKVSDVDCNLDSADYNNNNGYPLSNPLRWIRGEPSLGLSNQNNVSAKITGVTNFAGNTVNATDTVIKLEVSTSGAPVKELLIAGNDFLESGVAPGNDIYQYVPISSFAFETSFYITKTSGVEGTLKFFLNLGSSINTTYDPALAGNFDTTTFPGLTLLELNSFDLTPFSANTDINRLESSGNSYSFNLSPTQLLFGNAANATSTGIYNFEIIIAFEPDKLSGGPSFDATLYLDYFKIIGPSLNLANLLTINTVSFGTLTGYIIGWTALRDDIYLFTTDGTFNPDDSTTGPFTSTGQIWKFSYNKSGDYTAPNNYNLSLVYSNSQLNFTVYRPIANPGMIESRYENTFIQKIYWTDNYNVPRVINVADPNVASLTLEDLNLQPSLSMDLPLITQVIDGGNLVVGVYQVAYRLKNINGAETRFSRTSKFVPIIDATESNANVTNYYPEDPNFTPDKAANKSIRVRVNNLDIDYDTIEFVLIYFGQNGVEPTIDIVKEAFIPKITNSFVEVVITGGEDRIPITTDEFTAFNIYIKKAKTLAAKKQTLFLGNITTSDQSIDFDARAYRFPINSNTTTFTNESTSDNYIIDNNFQIININGNAVNPFDIPENYDCIQTYDNQSPKSDQNLLYQLNSNILGGTGPNVSYTFFTENVKLDNKYDDIGVAPNGSYGPYVTPDTNAIISFNSIDRNYVAEGTSLSNNASPYLYDLYVGYRRDEMYRFGIVFFDELDNPTYVNWIGDIRMPHIWMPDTTAGAWAPNEGTRSRIGNGFSDSFTSDIIYYDDNSDQLYSKPLGVKFTIDFSSVASKYKKAMIVRTPLKSTDRHVLGQGIFTPTYKTDGTSTDGDYVFTNNPYRGNFAFGNGVLNYNDIWYDCWCLHSPEFLFAEYPGLASDKIDLLGLLFTTDFNYLGVNNTSDDFNIGLNTDWQNDGDRLYTGFKIKTYKRLENFTALGTILDNPRAIKVSSSNNPYNIILAQVLQNEAGPNGNPTAEHNQTNRIVTLGSSSGGFNIIRQVWNCSPREPGNLSNLAVQNGNNPGASYNNKSLFIQLNNSQSFQLASSSGLNPGGYTTEDGWNSRATGLFHLYTANYIRNVASPFGGQGFFARSNSEYVSCKGLIDISNKANPITTKVYGGDTVISVLDHVLGFPDRYLSPQFDSNDRLDLFHSIAFVPLETSIAVDYRQNAEGINGHRTKVPNRINNPVLTFGVNDFTQWSTINSIVSDEYYYVYPVFNYSDTKEIYRYFPKPALIQPPTTFDCRVWKSEPKKDGELVESWSIFKPEAFLDVESAYGPINNLIIFQDKLFYFQDRAFGVLQVAAQKVLTNADNDISELVLGSSGILERYDYVSTKTGTKHQFSMSVSDYSMLWYDILARKMYRYKPGGLEPLTDIKGYGAYIYKHTGGDLQNFDNPYIGKGIHSTYDYRHNEFYMTFVNKDVIDNVDEIIFQDTLVYSDLFDGFVGSYTHYPKVYINDKINIFAAVTPQNSLFDNIYIHNYGEYGRFYDSRLWNPSKLSFVINSNPTVEKVFTNLEIVAESFGPNNIGDINYDSLSAIDYLDFFESIRVYDNYQNTDFMPTTGLSRRHKTIWNVKVPSDRVLSVTQNIFDFNNLDQVRPAITRRMKDKWFVVDLIYDPRPKLGQNKFVAHSAKAIYSVNSR